MSKIPSPVGYVLVEKLGSGSYATVYKCYHKNNIRKFVAVKCILRDSLNGRSAENMFTEIEILKTLEHENIVHLYDFMYDKNYIYLVMEYCNGRDFSAYMRKQRGCISEWSIRYFLQQIGFAMRYMRSMNVSHMDIKPQNILVSIVNSKYTIKIADFGFAHYLIETAPANMIRGTPLYMAPEVFRHCDYDEKADLWSIGIIIYECVYGEAPFTSTTIKEIKLKITESKPIQFPDTQISANLMNLMINLLKKDKKKRFTVDQFIKHPFLDLEFAPQASSLATGRELIRKAIDIDNIASPCEMDKYKSFQLYSRSIRHFMAAIHYESNEYIRMQIRNQVGKYLERAEQLKISIQNSSATVFDTDIGDLCSWYPALSDVVSAIEDAQTKQKQEDYTGALLIYERTIEQVLPILKIDSREGNKNVLLRHINLWMGNAERCKCLSTISIHPSGMQSLPTTRPGSCCVQ